jgi:ribose transport system permease protein
MSADAPAFRRPWLPLFGIALAASAVLSLTTTQFATAANGYVILANAALLCVIGFSQLAVLAVGEFSLAVAGIGNLTGVVIGFLMVEAGVPVLLAALAAIATGAAAGLLNGVVITRFGVNGFVVTLATGGAFTGLAVGITETSPYTGLPESFTTFGTGRWGLFPFLLVASIAVAALLAFCYRWLPAGRAMLAVGGNAEAAELSGLSVTRSVIGAHVLSGAIAAVAGIMAAAQLHEANPLAATDWLIQSFTIAIVGGTLLSGGSVSIAGVLAAALVLAMINDALILLHVDPYWVTLIHGALVFVAVLLGRHFAWSAVLGTLRRTTERRKVAA